MTEYRIAEAKERLPSLIDEASEGKPVVITCDGKPVAELRPTDQPCPPTAKEADAWLRARRQARKAVPITSVELLRQMY